jgi:hypothetical protein
VADGGAETPADGPVTIYVRPHHLEVHAAVASADHLWPARVQHVHLAGPLVRMELISAGETLLTAELSHERFERLRSDCAGVLEAGQEVRLGVQPDHLFIGGAGR